MILTYINLAVVAHCLLFGLFFLIKRKDGIGHTNIHLGILLILLSIISFSFALKSTGWIYDLPYLIDLDWAAGFWIIPVYKNYMKEMCGEKLEYDKNMAFQFLPGLIAFLYFSRFYFKSAEGQRAYIDLIQSTYLPEYEVADVVFYTYAISSFGYMIYWLYTRKSQLSGVYKKNAAWLLNFILFSLSLGVLGASIYMFKLPQLFIDLLPLSSASLYCCLIYRSIGAQKAYVAASEADWQEPKPKYTTSNLDLDEAIKLNNELQTVMEVNKPYLKSDLTLQALSQEIKIKPHYLSQIINQCHQKNFSDFVNFYRVKEAQRLILQNSNLKIEAIGYESGFNTKATFYAAFKKVSGCTPSEYRKKEQ
jgi:AraC-like DNA-binding protein